MHATTERREARYVAGQWQIGEICRLLACWTVASDPVIYGPVQLISDRPVACAFAFGLCTACLSPIDSYSQDTRDIESSRRILDIITTVTSGQSPWLWIRASSSWVRVSLKVARETAVAEC